MDELLHDQGIEQTTTAPYTPQSNGVAERINRTIMEKARVMLKRSNLGLENWPEAVPQEAMLYNRTPTKDKPSPFERLTGKKPDLSTIRKFGCLVYARIPPDKRTKLQDKALKMALLGTMPGKQHKLLDLDTGNIVYVRHAQFNETVFPKYGNHFDEYIWPTLDEFDQDRKESEDESDECPHDDDYEPESSDSDSDPDTDKKKDDGEWIDYHHSSSKENDSSNGNQTLEQATDDPDQDDDDDFEPDIEPASNSGPRRTSGRERSQPQRYTPPSLLIAKKKPVSKVHDPDHPTLKEALSGPSSGDWKKAIDKELNMLRERKTWTMVPRPNKRVLPSKVILKVKRKGDGTIERLKARLVALGCLQRDEDYNELFLPVVDFTTVRTALALAELNQETVTHLDITGAFLYADLTEEIYMALPVGLENEKHPDHVCKLHKSLYGLKQAPKAWSDYLKTKLTTLNFTPVPYAECVYEVRLNGQVARLLVYVDDMLLISRSHEIVNKTNKDLSRLFQVTDLGPMSYFLGCQYTSGFGRNNKRIPRYLHQTKYIKEVLRSHRMEDCHPVTTPMESSMVSTLTKKFKEDNLEMADIPYRKAIGQLLYLATNTRPDIAAAVGLLSRQVSHPQPHHWTAVKRVLRYLKGTTNLGLYMTPTGNPVLYASSDADWGSEADRISISGYLMTLGNVLITWGSKKQTAVSLSSTESEYYALSLACQVVTWLRNLCESFGNKQTAPTVVQQDNSGAVCWTEEGGQFSRNKHVSLRYHHTRCLIKQGIITLQQTPNDHIWADMFTKALGSQKFAKNRDDFLRLLPIRTQEDTSSALFSHTGIYGLTSQKYSATSDTHTGSNASGTRLVSDIANTGYQEKLKTNVTTFQTDVTKLSTFETDVTNFRKIIWFWILKSSKSSKNSKESNLALYLRSCTGKKQPRL